MIKIKRISPSGYSKWSFCEMQYYISYGLGYREPGNKKAEMGVVVHKVMEILGLLKLSYQNTGEAKATDEDLGEISVSYEELIRPTLLSIDKVYEENKARSNKYKYKDCQLLNENHIRYGEAFVKEIFDKSYNHFSSLHHEKWNNSDYIDCWNWLWLGLEYRGGWFDPRFRDIIDAELNFSITFEYPWAKIDDSFLEMKGVIDLVARHNDIVEIIDWKTGSRKDWGTGEIKSYEYLMTDIQLLAYYYAAKRFYPDNPISTTIFFIRDGGPYTFWFDENSIATLESKIEKRFIEIKNCVKPKMCDPTQQDKKCKDFCAFKKMKSPDGEKNFCKFINDSIDEIGIEKTTELYENKERKK